jgi:hypothetical protein
MAKATDMPMIKFHKYQRVIVIVSLGGGNTLTMWKEKAEAKLPLFPSLPHYFSYVRGGLVMLCRWRLPGR